MTTLQHKHTFMVFLIQIESIGMIKCAFSQFGCDDKWRGSCVIMFDL